MVTVYMHTTGQHLDCHEEFKARIASRVHVRQESNPNVCDLILAFCTITSRVGTDVEAAVKEIPGGKPVILVVCHHTFDEDYVVPDSRRFIGRPNVLLVNILFHETRGLLRCLQNDEELKTVSDYLIGQGAEAPHAPASPPNNDNRRRLIGGLISAAVLIVVVCILVLLIEYQQGNLGYGSSSTNYSTTGPNDSIRDPDESIKKPNMQ